MKAVANFGAVLRVCFPLVAAGVCMAVSGCSRGSAPVAERPAYVRVELPPEENGFPLWTNALAQMLAPEPTKELKNAIRAAQNNASLDGIREVLTAWLDEKQEAYRLVGEALEMRLQFPDPVQTCFDLDVDGAISGWVVLGQLKGVAGRLHAERGAFEAAAREYLDVVRMAERIAAGEGSFFSERSLYQSLYYEALEMLRRFCLDANVPVAVLRDLLEKFPEAPAVDSNLAVTFAIGQATLADGIRRVAGSPRSVSFSDRTKKIFYSLQTDAAATDALAADFFRCYQANALCATLMACDRSLAEMYENDLRGNVDFDNESWGKIVLDSLSNQNRVGIMFVKAFAWLADSKLRNSFSVRTYRNLTRVAIALRIFQRETGGYPDSLEELVERGILERLPVDLVSGGPLRYSAARGLVWSVGEDGIDDGGVENKDWVVELPE